MTVLVVLVGLFLALWAVPVYLEVRNAICLRYRLRVLAEVHKMAQLDIASGRPWLWRYERLDAVRYSRMVLSVRRPSSFYAGRSPLADTEDQP